MKNTNPKITQSLLRENSTEWSNSQERKILLSQQLQRNAVKITSINIPKILHE